MHVMLSALLALSIICLNSSTQENLALRRPAFQKTNWNSVWGAERAVDGNTNAIFDGDSCTHTTLTVQPWWAVDLGKTTCITDVTLTNRAGGAGAYQRLADFQIGATNTHPNENKPLVGDYFVCASQVPAMGEGETKNFVCKAAGQYLIVQLKGENILTLCEVEVYGNDFFGDRCQFNEGEMYSFHTDETTTYETVHLATLFNYALFSVRVCKDAYLALSANPGDTTADTTEVILGVGTNSNSEIRNGVNGDVAVTASTPDILSCENQTSFWISWKGGEIRIGGGDVVGTDQILQSTISHTVSWIHIRTGQDVGVWRVPRINVKFVEQETKSEHSFEQMSLDQRDLPYQSFRVQACSDVHVVLSSVVHHNETFVTGTTYEVVIGGWGNTKSAIRVGLLSGNEWNVTVDTSNFLTCDQYSPFWIKWEENAIKVGQGEDPEQNLFMNLTDENWMFAPTSMGISTGNSTGGKWQFKNLDCSKCLNDATNCVAQSAPEDFEVNCTCAPGYHGDQCGYTYVADNVTLIAEPKPFMEAYQRCQELEYTMLAFTEGDLQHETLRNLTNCGYNGNVWIALHKTEYAELLMIPWGIPPPYTNFPSGVEATLGFSPDWAVSVNLATLEWGVTNASLELPYVCEGGNDPCSDTCKNGGTCCNIDLSFKCTCVDGFTGDRCELIDHCLNITTCANNFTCKLNSGNTDFYCNCNDKFDFFGGKLCEFEEYGWNTRCGILPTSYTKWLLDPGRLKIQSYRYKLWFWGGVPGMLNVGNNRVYNTEDYSLYDNNDLAWISYFTLLYPDDLTFELVAVLCGKSDTCTKSFVKMDPFVLSVSGKNVTATWTVQYPNVPNVVVSCETTPGVRHYYVIRISTRETKIMSLAIDGVTCDTETGIHYWLRPSTVTKHYLYPRAMMYLYFLRLSTRLFSDREITTESNAICPNNCKPCLNGGKCVANGTTTACVCKPGFSGVNCDQDLDLCAGIVCEHNSTCGEVNQVRAKCDCKPPYYGTTCSAVKYNIPSFECLMRWKPSSILHYMGSLGLLNNVPSMNYPRTTVFQWNSNVFNVEMTSPEFSSIELLAEVVSENGGLFVMINNWGLYIDRKCHGFINTVEGKHLFEFDIPELHETAYTLHYFVMTFEASTSTLMVYLDDDAVINDTVKPLNLTANTLHVGPSSAVGVRDDPVPRRNLILYYFRVSNEVRTPTEVKEFNKKLCNFEPNLTTSVLPSYTDDLLLDFVNDTEEIMPTGTNITDKSFKAQKVMVHNDETGNASIKIDEGGNKYLHLPKGSYLTVDFPTIYEKAYSIEMVVKVNRGEGYIFQIGTENKKTSYIHVKDRRLSIKLHTKGYKYLTSGRAVDFSIGYIHYITVTFKYSYATTSVYVDGIAFAPAHAGHHHMHSTWRHGFFRSWDSNREILVGKGNALDIDLYYLRMSRLTINRRELTLEGNALHFDECNSNPCMRGGTCTEGYKKFTCTCSLQSHGITCEKVNLALGKPALQSSNYQGEITEASNGVDGAHRNTGYSIAGSSGQCTYTNIQSNPWWSVDLGASYRIDHVVVVNWWTRYYGRLRNFHIGTNAVNPNISAPTLDKIHVCARRTEHVPNGGSIKLDCHTIGKYVVIQKTDRDYLAFCELQVFGLPSDIVYCDGNPCMRDGPCIAGNNGTYACECASGWEGTHCETETNECKSNPCLNGMECFDQFDKFMCNCTGGYSGMRCEREPGYVGCFAENVTDNQVISRDLGHMNEGISLKTMTLKYCIEACRDMERDYAGLQNAQECYCGNSYGHSGPATNCDMACRGDSLRICGGNGANSVYKTRVTCDGNNQYWDLERGICYTIHSTKKTYDEAVAQCSNDQSSLASVLSPETNQRLQSLMLNHSVNEILLGLKLVKENPSLWSWSERFPALEQGCYIDKSEDHDLPVPVEDLWSFEYISPLVCIQECAHMGYKYAGIQGKLISYKYNHPHRSLMDFQCFCGDSFGKHGESVYPETTLCTITCADPEESLCGNLDRNSILAVNGAYATWWPSQPDNKAGNEYCGLMMNRYNNYKFEDESCASKNAYICDVPGTECLKPSRNDVLYKPWKDKCFLFSGFDRQSWHRARFLCTDLGGSLVQVISKEMHHFLALALIKVDLKHWIGLSKQKYRWQLLARKQPLAWSQVWSHFADSELWSNWADSQPTMNQDCGSIEKVTTPEEFMWKSRACNKPSAFVCAREHTSGWTCFNTGCYYLPTLFYQKNKAEADAICASMGAHVAAPETKAEQDTIMKLVFKSGGYKSPYAAHGLWINLIKDTTWAHSGEAVTYTKWQKGQPYNPKMTFCTVLQNGLWRDIGCHYKKTYICERD